MTTKTKYALQYWTLKDADPQLIGEFLEALIDEKNEHVTAEEIIAAAKRSDSPLHPCFLWDDPEAAHRFRKSQARRLVKHLFVQKAGEPTRTRAFYYVRHPEHGTKKVLMATRSAMARPEMREQIIEQAVASVQRMAKNWQERYGTIGALRGLKRDLDKLKDKAEKELLQSV